jgi:predicted permease
MLGLWQDLRYGAKMLVKHRGFTTLAVLSLALGMGANATIFSFSNALLLRTLPVEEPQRLVAVTTSYVGGGRHGPTSLPDYEDLRDRNDVFSGVAAHAYFPMALTGPGRPEVVIGQLVTWNFFSVLGVEPFLGRSFLPEEDQTPGSHPVAILSYRIWQRRFGSDREVVGQTVHINDFPFIVVGVAPEGFGGLRVIVSPDVWTPTMMVGKVYPSHVALDGRSDPWLEAVGRLKPGVTLASAQASLRVLSASLGQEYPENRGEQFTVVEANRARAFGGTTDDLKRFTAILAGLVGLVLLIACFNVANLLLAKASRRQKEIGLRLSLGASPRRILRQLLTESLLLSALAGAVGLLIAAWAVEFYRVFDPPSFFRLEIDFSLDRRVLGFTALVSVLTGVVFGLAPALQVSRSGQLAALKDQPPALGQDRRRSRLQSSLVTAQVALCLVSLIAAGLLLRSLSNTLAVDPGFETRNGLVLPINLGFGQYEEAEGRQFFRQAVERVASLAGVRSAALAAYVPLGPVHGSHWVRIEGYERGEGESMQLKRNMVSPDYFETMGIPILRGRGISDADTETTRPVAVVNETMARRYWAGRDPLGGVIRMGDLTLEVVGVMKDGRYGGLDDEPEPYFCLPMRQDAFEKWSNLVVRTAGDPGAMMPTVLEEIRGLDPNLPVSNVLTMDQFLNHSLAEAKSTTALVGIFAFVALTLAMVGVYGVISFSVSQRTREFGIRMALGARRGELLGMVLGQGMKLALMGVGIGLVMALGVTRVLSGLLFEVDPLDPFVFLGVSLVLATVAALACYLPARGATRADPMAALRYE